jgi:kumamolisin
MNRQLDFVADTSRQKIQHIPGALKRFTEQGVLSSDQQISMSIALRFRDAQELDRQIQKMYDPSSPEFHHFLAPSEFRARWAPSAETVERVESYLEAQGFDSMSLDPNGYLLKAKGRVDRVNAAFHTELRRYREIPLAGPVSPELEYYAPASEPEIPADLGILAVHGLSNVSHLKSYAHRRQEVAQLHEGLGPAELRAAYGIPSIVDGRGQSLALVELDGYDPADISQYEQSYGLPNVALHNELLDGAKGSVGARSYEVTLDLELMIAVAPAIDQIFVYEAPNRTDALLDLYSRVANDHLAMQISTSWGIAESEASSAFLETENAIFKQMAAQGQSVFAAAGDAGAEDDGRNLSVDDPGSQPYVVSVGGTHLALDLGDPQKDGPKYLGETTWNSGSATQGAGGGGISSVWVQPSWQNGIANAQNLASTRMRNVPDVSLNADPQTGYAVFAGGSWVVYGGTSCAAPIWAAFTALVNEQRVANGLDNLGFPAPYLYLIGFSDRYLIDFHDIADGSTNLFYPATPGYDDATGLGSFNAKALFDDLSKDPQQTLGLQSC